MVFWSGDVEHWLGYHAPTFVLADCKEDAVKAEAQKLAAAGHEAIAVRCGVGCAGGAVYGFAAGVLPERR